MTAVRCWCSRSTASTLSFFVDQVTFSGAEALALFLEGSAPGFNCMNEYYGLSFVKGDAGETFAVGTLTADKVRRGATLLRLSLGRGGGLVWAGRLVGSGSFIYIYLVCTSN